MLDHCQKMYDMYRAKGNYSSAAYWKYRMLLEEKVEKEQQLDMKEDDPIDKDLDTKGDDPMDVKNLRVVSTGSSGRTQMEITRARWYVLYGIAKGRSIPEIAVTVGRTISTVYEMMERLRDEGFIEPWERNKARSKRLTERGQEWVNSGYRDSISGN